MEHTLHGEVCHQAAPGGRKVDTNQNSRNEINAEDVMEDDEA